MSCTAMARVASFVGACVALTLGCAVRVGSHSSNGGTDTGGPADGTNGGANPPPLPSACKVSTLEKKIATPAGTASFAWLWDRDHFVVAYVDPQSGSGDIATLLLSADGSPLGAPHVVEATDAASDLPTMVKTQNGYLIAWQEGTAGKAAYAHAVDGAGAPVGAGVTVGASSSDQARPVISGAPGGFVVAYMDKPLGAPVVDVAFLDANMNVSGPGRVPASGVGAYPWLAGDSNGVSILWSDRRGASYDIHFGPLDPSSLAVMSDVAVRTGAPNDALLGRMIKTDFGFLSAWEDMRADDNQIYFALTKSDGSILYEGVAEEPNSGDANWPNMAWTGSAAGIVYYQFRDGGPQVFISFVDGTGKRVGGLHDLQVSKSARAARFPDVQWTGTSFGVAWIDTRDGRPELYFAQVTCRG
jgi:hypothetical protein